MTDRRPPSPPEGDGRPSEDPSSYGYTFPGTPETPSARGHDLDGGIRPRFQDQEGDPPAWEWRDGNSVGHQVLIVTAWTAGFMCVVTFLAWLFSGTTDCSTRDGLTCYLGGLLLAIIFPIVGVPVLARILRSRGIERPRAVAITSGVALAGVTFVDRFVVGNAAFLGPAMPWWIDLPIVVTAISAVVTAVVTSYNRYV